MKTSACLTMLTCVIALSACGDDTDPAGSGTTEDDTATTDQVATTIPVTSVTDTTPDPTTATSTSSTSGTDASTGGETASASSSSGADSGAETDGSTSRSTGSSSSTGDGTTDGATWDIEWCNLQFPATIETDTAATTTAYARVYVEGLTDLTPGNDLDAQLQVEFGYGADASDPAVDGWTWVSGVGNGGWNGNTAGQPDNDEYQGELQFEASGTYDYAARVSGDAGETWVYCDLNGLVDGGYTSDQAGNAVIE